jgi:hypothetical protein
VKLTNRASKDNLSTPTEKSVMVSLPSPGTKINLSEPPPPVKVSLPTPPISQSSPRPPLRWSPPVSPKILSLPPPPVSVSFPARPYMISSLGTSLRSPKRLSLLSVPNTSSPCTSRPLYPYFVEIVVKKFLKFSRTNKHLQTLVIRSSRVRVSR